MIDIRPALESDWCRMWGIFGEVVRGGDTYAFASDTPELDAYAYWFGPGIASYVATEGNDVLGMYKLVANHRDLGSHVANASFMVAPAAQGRGVGRAMGLAALDEARSRAFLAMQFNFVVSTNRPAVHLWMSLGFEIAGTLPGAFRHATLGLVDVYVMYRFL